MKRRDFCKKAYTLAMIGAVTPYLGKSAEPLLPFKYGGIKRFKNSHSAPVPVGQRILNGYPYFSITSDKPDNFFECLNLTHVNEADIYLRLQVALDHKNEDEVGVYLGRSNRKIGNLSIWYPTGLQIFETKLTCTVDELKRNGISLRLEGGSYCSFFFETTADNGSHLMIVDKNINKLDSDTVWQDMLCSPRSLQPFSWTEGCVLDGMQELYIRTGDKRMLAALQRHLKVYLPNNKDLIYADLLGRPLDNTFSNLETGLPFAVIAKHLPDHASIQLYIDFCKKRFDEAGNYKPVHLTTEGCYTLAYPLAALAKELDAPELYELALLEIEKRVEVLTEEDAVYGSGHVVKGKSYIRRNWGRGYVWFLLGIVRTVELLDLHTLYKGTARVEKLKGVYRYFALKAIKFQCVDHSWSSFLDQTKPSFESSATAGLAAAFAHGNRLGWLPEFDKERLQLVYNKLLQHTTEDGLLKDVSQHNAGSINLLQRGEYRVIAQYALGFMAHIKAHL